MKLFYAENNVPTWCCQNPVLGGFERGKSSAFTAYAMSKHFKNTGGVRLSLNSVCARMFQYEYYSAPICDRAHRFQTLYYIMHEVLYDCIPY